MTPTITDWLMVGITAVYVIATIFIWIANYKSAQATHDQLEESKRQFEETKKANQQQLETMRLQLEESKRQYEENRRLDIMPYLQLKITDRFSFPDTKIELYILDGSFDKNAFEDRCISGCELRNIGRGTAKDIDCESFECEIPSTDVKFRTTALQSGGMQTINLMISAKHSINNLPCISLVLYYKDLFENRYRQIVEMDVVHRASSNESFVLNSTTHPPELVSEE